MSQYSSCPTLINVLHRSPRSGVTRSLFEQYVTSYPCCSKKYASGNSNGRYSPAPTVSGSFTMPACCASRPYGLSKLTSFHGPCVSFGLVYSEKLFGQRLYACHVLSEH